jgi:hypothetical protein
VQPLQERRISGNIGEEARHVAVTLTGYLKLRENGSDDHHLEYAAVADVGPELHFLVMTSAGLGDAFKNNVD